jgi:hypothetical protein
MRRGQSRSAWPNYAEPEGYCLVFDIGEVARDARGGGKGPVLGLADAGTCPLRRRARGEYSIAIGHKEDERFVVDVVRGRPGPFDPAEVTHEYAELCKEYRIESVIGYLYGHQWV